MKPSTAAVVLEIRSFLCVLLASHTNTSSRPSLTLRAAVLSLNEMFLLRCFLGLDVMLFAAHPLSVCHLTVHVIIVDVSCLTVINVPEKWKKCMSV